MEPWVSWWYSFSRRKETTPWHELMLRMHPQARKKIQFILFVFHCPHFLKSMVLGLGTAEASRNFLEIWILRCLPNVHNQPQGHTFLTLFPRDSNRPNVYELLSYGSVSLFHLDCFSAKLCSSYKLAYANRNVLNIYIFYSCISLNTQRNLRH